MLLTVLDCNNDGDDAREEHGMYNVHTTIATTTLWNTTKTVCADDDNDDDDKPTRGQG